MIVRCVRARRARRRCTPRTTIQDRAQRSGGALEAVAQATERVVFQHEQHPRVARHVVHQLTKLAQHAIPSRVCRLALQVAAVFAAHKLGHLKHPLVHLGHQLAGTTPWYGRRNALGRRLDTVFRGRTSGGLRARHSRWRVLVAPTDLTTGAPFGQSERPKELNTSYAQLVTGRGSQVLKLARAP